MRMVRGRRDEEVPEGDRLRCALVGVKALLEHSTMAAFTRDPALRELAFQTAEVLLSLADGARRQAELDLARATGEDA